MLAIISDVHGNLSALDAVLEDIDRAGCERIVCLGDVANFGPQPQETLHRVRTLGIPVVRGNTDEYLLRQRTADDVTKVNDDTPRFLAIENWCAAQMDEADRAYLQALPKTVGVEVGGLEPLCCHGSPRSHSDIIVATTPDDTLGHYLAGVTATLVASGHSHAPLLRRYRDKLFVNPGSVGLPYEILPNGDARNPPWAEYALLRVVDRHPRIEFRRVPYDIQPVIAAAYEHDMPFADWWTEGWRRG
ncbi:MAG: metallophosphoesterase family protein [Trueperaceae bacterium]|nr:metallophosphoesterase family protein [Trueperaceae bacterium]